MDDKIIKNKLIDNLESLISVLKEDTVYVTEGLHKITEEDHDSLGHMNNRSLEVEIYAKLIDTTEEKKKD